MTAVHADAQKCSEQFLIPEGRKILSEDGLKIMPYFSFAERPGWVCAPQGPPPKASRLRQRPPAFYKDRDRQRRRPLSWNSSVWGCLAYLSGMAGVGTATAKIAAALAERKPIRGCNPI
jgi:hypothetical protein